MTLATGGNSTFDSGGYRYHVFTSSGSLSISVGGTLDILLVGGGGGGGSAYADAYSAGGGGGGEVKTLAGATLTSGTLSVAVGTGGSGGSGAGMNNGSAGGASEASGAGLSLTSAAGGGYGAGANNVGGGSGGSGGSGGGGSAANSGGSSTASGGGLGNAGATASDANTDPTYFGGGGGGAGAAGTQFGVGGDGAAVWGTTYGGGGGGGSYSSAAGNVGGSGGGGAGGDNAAGSNGTANTGGGGGGAGHAGAVPAGNSGGDGGSGIVIVRYLLSSPTPPVASFTRTPSSGTAPLNVSFTDTTTNSPTSWAWDFDDGGTSTSQNPSHTFTTPGTYFVSLDATNADGTDSYVLSVTVTSGEGGGGGGGGGGTTTTSQFGCGYTEVWVCDRALRRPLVQIGFQRCDWSRELSQLSHASIDVPEAWCSPLNSDVLGGPIETWKFGLMVIRDGTIQWRGPIVDINRPPDSEVVSIEARDKMAWLEARFLEVLLEYGSIDDSAMFDILVQEAVRRDNRFRLVTNSRPSGNAVARSYPADGTSSILSLIGDLTQAGMDWTVLDDAVISGGEIWRDLSKLVATEEAFNGKIGVRLDGLSRGNAWRLAGKQGSNVVGEYEEWTPAEGLLQRAAQEEGLLDSDDAYASARERVTRNGGQPIVVSLPSLSERFPAAMETISPGQRLDLAVDDPVFDPSGRYTVVALKVAVSQTEAGQTETATIEVEQFG